VQVFNFIEAELR